MATTDDSVGSDMPSLSADQEAAFAAEERAASTARTEAKGLGHQRLTTDADGDEPAPAAPAPKAPDAPAVPAADPKAAAPAAPAAPAPAEPDDDAPDAVTAQDGKRYVPVATLVATRKSLQGQLKDAQTIIEEGNKRLNTLLEIAQKQAGAPPAPKAETPAPAAPEVNPYDKTTHPLEHLEWENGQLRKDVAAITDWRKNQETTSAQTQAMTEAKTAYVTMHRQFVGQNPAYDGAYRHVMDTWVAVNRATGMSEPEAIRAAEQLEWQVVERAVKGNHHPSAMLMEIAKAAGWKPAAPAAIPGVGAAPGTPAAAAPAAPATPDPAKQIKLAQEGAAAAVSLSDAAGGSAPQAMTLAQLAALPKEEFHARFAGAKGEEEFRKLAMGTKRQ